MENRLMQLLSRPKVAYASLTLAAFLFGIILLLIFLSDLEDSSVILLLALGAVFFTWLGILSSMFESRRAKRRLRDDLRKQIREMHRDSNREFAGVKKEILLAQEQHVEEYRKHAFSVLLSNQELRLAVLEEKEQRVEDE